MIEIIVGMSIWVYMIQLIVLFLIVAFQSSNNVKKEDSIVRTKKDLYKWLTPFYVLYLAWCAIMDYVNSLDDE